MTRCRGLHEDAPRARASAPGDSLRQLVLFTLEKRRFWREPGAPSSALCFRQWAWPPTCIVKGHKQCSISACFQDRHISVLSPGRLTGAGLCFCLHPRHVLELVTHLPQSHSIYRLNLLQGRAGSLRAGWDDAARELREIKIPSFLQLTS